MYKSQSGRCWWVSWVSAAQFPKNQVGITKRGNDCSVESGYQKGCRHLTLRRTLQSTKAYTATLFHLTLTILIGRQHFSHFTDEKAEALRSFCDWSRKKKNKHWYKWLRTQSLVSDPSLCHGHPWTGVQFRQWSLWGLRRFRKGQMRRWQYGTRTVRPAMLQCKTRLEMQTPDWKKQDL